MEFTPAPESEQTRSYVATWQSPDKSRGLNGSTQHMLEADGQGFSQMAASGSSASHLKDGATKKPTCIIEHDEPLMRNIYEDIWNKATVLI